MIISRTADDKGKLNTGIKILYSESECDTQIHRNPFCVLISFQSVQLVGLFFGHLIRNPRKLTHMHSSWGKRKRPWLEEGVNKLAATVHYINDCRCKTSWKVSGERTLIWWCNMNSLYVIVSIPLLLVLAGFNHAHGLTTFGKSNSQGQTNNQPTGTDVTIYNNFV